MNFKAFILITGLVIFGAACSKKAEDHNSKYTPEEFAHIMGTTTASDDKVPEHAINFSDYSPGVSRLTSRAMVYERLSFAVVEFETVDQARNEALRLGQYYSRNFLFDKVDGEPILEDLVIVKFHAINPKKHTQRKPVNIPHEGHGGGAPAGGH
ncbi:MAG: hypothetical protein K2Q18_05395 [Bdellovibrionales bacterium]|nr:hypothetical protein [Bdellovibrionales bacterium]